MSHSANRQPRTKGSLCQPCLRPRRFPCCVSLQNLQCHRHWRAMSQIKQVCFLPLSVFLCCLPLSWVTLWQTCAMLAHHPGAVKLRTKPPVSLGATATDVAHGTGESPSAVELAAEPGGDGAAGPTADADGSPGSTPGPPPLARAAQEPPRRRQQQDPRVTKVNDELGPPIVTPSAEAVSGAARFVCGVRGGCCSCLEY
jgi:hypothetical protein